MDELTRAYLTLSHARGIGPRKVKLLLETLGSASAILQASDKELQQVEGVGVSLVRALNEAKTSEWPVQEVKRAEKLGINILHGEHPDYPDALKAIFDPPTILYVKGEMPKLEGVTPRSVGIVGTRNASEYALGFSKDLARQLAEAGVAVMSGLALGVDSAAHEGAVSVLTGKTVAVLGSGVDNIYPSQNRRLAKQISEGFGAVISEYPLGSRPLASNFPGRNRIINGLSRGVVVVEAGKKSGALITADYALEEGRTVFAVPGRVGDPRASGSLSLLKQGAILLESAEDIFNEFSWSASVSAQASTERLEALNVTGKEKTILQSIQTLENPLLDDLVMSLSMQASELLPLLTMLELKGLIKTTAGGRYVLPVPLSLST